VLYHEENKTAKQTDIGGKDSALRTLIGTCTNLYALALFGVEQGNYKLG
jgi:hypothetical protein